MTFTAVPHPTIHTDGKLPWVYGPVQSRRHGFSLGINLGCVDHKVCTWSCVYCQCGFGQLREFNPDEKRPAINEIIDQVKQVIFQNPTIDTITFAGNTEPGTYPEILPLMKALVRLRVMMRAKFKIMVLSNGSELDRTDVVSAFDLADATYVKLDCGMDPLFRKLNHPHPSRGGLSEHLLRMKKLKRLRIQTLLFQGSEEHPELTNFSGDNLKALEGWYQDLKPIEIHATTVARDTAMKGLQPVETQQAEEWVSHLNALGLKSLFFG